jgi:hypothetical protein
MTSVEAGAETIPYRTTSNAVGVVVEGTGSSRVGNEIFAWQPKDIFSMPHGNRVSPLRERERHTVRGDGSRSAAAPRSAERGLPQRTPVKQHRQSPLMLAPQCTSGSASRQGRAQHARCCPARGPLRQAGSCDSADIWYYGTEIFTRLRACPEFNRQTLRHTEA